MKVDKTDFLPRFNKISVAEQQAEEAVKNLNFSSEIATKTDLAEMKGELKVMVFQLEIKMLKWSIVLAGMVIAAVGLLVKL